MKALRRVLQSFVILSFAVVTASSLLAQDKKKPFEPVVGQSGKDVVWVPTPFVTVEKMLDMAKVTPQDFVMDLGSGDGRNVIAAAKRGANALGVEWNEDMVELARRRAQEAGVADKAKFVQGDMYAADISKASAKLAEQQATLRASLVTRFAHADTRIGTSKSTLSFLQSQIDAWNASRD